MIRKLILKIVDLIIYEVQLTMWWGDTAYLRNTYKKLNFKQGMVSEDSFSGKQQYRFKPWILMDGG